MYEGPDQYGVGSFLESTAFQSTASRSSRDLHALSTHNGISLSAANSREIITYRADCVRGSVPLSVELLADTLRNPVISDAEVQYARVSIFLMCLLAS